MTSSAIAGAIDVQQCFTTRRPGRLDRQATGHVAADEPWSRGDAPAQVGRSLTSALA